MCEKVIIENSGILEFIPDCYKNQNMCDKAVVLPQYNLLLNAISIKKTCDKAIDTCPFVVDSVHDQYVTQEMRDKVVSKELIIPKYCPD